MSFKILSVITLFMPILDFDSQVKLSLTVINVSNEVLVHFHCNGTELCARVVLMMQSAMEVKKFL